jgi:hypothetical protein
MHSPRLFLLATIVTFWVLACSVVAQAERSTVVPTISTRPPSPSPSQTVNDCAAPQAERCPTPGVDRTKSTIIDPAVDNFLTRSFSFRLLPTWNDLPSLRTLYHLLFYRNQMCKILRHMPNLLANLEFSGARHRSVRPTAFLSSTRSGVVAVGVALGG